MATRRTTVTVRRSRYGFWQFVRDLLGTIVTMALCGGFPVWWVWIFIREMRR